MLEAAYSTGGAAELPRFIEDFRLDAAHGCDIKVFPEAGDLRTPRPCFIEKR